MKTIDTLINDMEQVVLGLGGWDKAITEYLATKSTRLNSSHGYISYAVFCLKKKNNDKDTPSSKEQNTSS